MAISSGLGSSALLPAGLGFRNTIINGGMDVWQRGSSGVAISNGVIATAFLADRWCSYRPASGSTQSRVTANLDGFQYALRMQRDFNNTSVAALYMNQSIETNTMMKLANKQVTLSFYARAGANYSASGSLFGARVVAGTGTDINIIYTGVTGGSEPVSTTPVLTTSWQRFTATGLIPSGTTAGGVYFFFTPTGTAGADDYVDITGVQLEQNLQPTPFEQRPIGVELELCQRYYEKTYDSGTAPGTASTQIGMVGNDVSSSNTNEYIICRMRYQVQKRVAPTITAYDGAGNSGKATRYSLIGAPTDNTSVGIDTIGEKSFRMYIGTGLANNAGFTIHYTASAEL